MAPRSVRFQQLHVTHKSTLAEHGRKSNHRLRTILLTLFAGGAPAQRPRHDVRGQLENVMMRIARNVAEALKSNPLVLALVVVNVLYLTGGFVWLREECARGRRDPRVDSNIA